MPDPSPFVLALDGRSGAGKTELARRLAEELRAQGRSCTVVHLDDLYPGWSGLAAALPRLCLDVLTPLRAGRPGRFTAWDWHQDRPGPEVQVPLADVLLVDGVGAGASDCPDLVDAVVWIEVAADVRRERALRRDGATFAPYWHSWAAQEDHLFATRGGPARADLVVCSTAEVDADVLPRLGAHWAP